MNCYGSMMSGVPKPSAESSEMKYWAVDIPPVCLHNDGIVNHYHPSTSPYSIGLKDKDIALLAFPK